MLIDGSAPSRAGMCWMFAEALVNKSGPWHMLILSVVLHHIHCWEVRQGSSFKAKICSGTKMLWGERITFYINWICNLDWLVNERVLLTNVRMYIRSKMHVPSVYYRWQFPPWRDFSYEQRYVFAQVSFTEASYWTLFLTLRDCRDISRDLVAHWWWRHRVNEK